jgi:hypothetical protein
LRQRTGPFLFLSSHFLFVKEIPMKTTLKHRPHRNPLVALARFRKAGSHRMLGGSQRQQAARALQREMERMKQSP